MVDSVKHYNIYNCETHALDSLSKMNPSSSHFMLWSYLVFTFSRQDYGKYCQVGWSNLNCFSIKVHNLKKNYFSSIQTQNFGLCREQISYIVTFSRENATVTFSNISCKSWDIMMFLGWPSHICRVPWSRLVYTEVWLLRPVHKDSRVMFPYRAIFYWSAYMEQ